MNRDDETPEEALKRRMFLAEVTEHYEELNAERLREWSESRGALWPGQGAQIVSSFTELMNLYESAYGDEPGQWPGPWKSPELGDISERE